MPPLDTRARASASALQSSSLACLLLLHLSFVVAPLIRLTCHLISLIHHAEDLKLLAPLHNLRELKLLAHAQEEHQLLALTNGVLDTWRVSFQHLTCLHFSGELVRSIEDCILNSAGYMCCNAFTIRCAGLTRLKMTEIG
eukprot:1158039-Pelagomonas_calceolata.AAC.13